MTADVRATAVLAVLAGVSAELVAQRNGVAREVLDSWVEVFVAGGRQGLAGETTAEAVVQRDRHLGVVAHELRSPLQMIRGWAELLADEVDTDLIPRAAAGIVAQVDRLQRLSDDAVDATAVALGRLRLFPTTESLAATVAAIVGARSVGRPVLVVDDDAMVDIDVDRFGQILDNLLENARMHGDGRATITVRRHADDAIVTISSPGQPIAPEDVQRLFEPFQRGRTDADGVGLGLFVCRSLVAAHGGQMGLRTSVDGNHFWLRLPVSPQTRSPVTTKDTCRAISTPWSAMRS